MGCGQSKIENEEAVLRCKDRKLYMKDAVSARNAFAAAHSSYATYLKNTGAALSDFANGEVAHFHSSPSAHSTVHSSSAASTSAPTFDPFPPPPPDPNFRFPLQRAATMPEIKIQKPDPQRLVTGTIIEEEEGVESDGEDPRTRLKRRSGSSHKNSRVVEDEGGPPPIVSREEVPMPPQQHNTPYEYLFSVDNMPGTTFSDAIPVAEFVEVSLRNGEMERKVSEEKSKRVDDDRSVGGGGEEVKGTEKIEAAVPAAGRIVKKVKLAEGKRMAKSNLNLLQIFLELDDDFLKASESAHEVSKLLEATRLHYHSNFADNRGNVLELFNF